MKKLLLCLLLTLILVGCGSGESSKSDIKKPYGYPTKNMMSKMLHVKNTGEDAKSVFGRIVGEININGTSYSRFLVNYADETGLKPVNDPDTDNEMWIALTPEGEIEEIVIAGVNRHNGEAEGTVEPPIKVNIKAPVGEPQTVETTYTGSLPEVSGTHTVSFLGSYTVVSKEESVMTEAGMVHGCTHIKAEGNLTGENLPAIVTGIPLEAELWGHESLGVVKAKVPLLGLDWSHESSWDLEDLGNGYRIIKKSGIVNSRNPNWSLSTFDVAEKLDADKKVHAKMLLEVRWADENLAKNSSLQIDDHPSVNISFTTVWGEFFYNMIESPISIFHPEDNGKGYKFYYAFVDQAAKNEPGDDGIIYSINVTNSGSQEMPDIKATGKIYYHTVNP
ncbi:MAG: hypothetical protein ACOX2F_05950 [bacterium]